jgi:hypothetical protein
MNRSVYVWAALAFVVGAAAFLAGRELRPADERQTFVFDTTAPPFSVAAGIAATSLGGFDGLGAFDGREGDAIIGGEVVRLSSGLLTLRTPAGEQTLQLNPGASVYRVEAAANLPAGASIAVLSDDGEIADGILIVSTP